MSQNQNDTVSLIQRYYDAFNAKDVPGMLSCLASDVVHEINQGSTEIGQKVFGNFLERMNHCYEENITDIVVLTHPAGLRAAAEYVVHGKYVHTDEGFLPAQGQTYVLKGGAFFEIREGLIARVTNYYNLKEWLGLVGG
jgi:steroid delta-isomerase-like uncharacterized protein